MIEKVNSFNLNNIDLVNNKKKKENIVFKLIDKTNNLALKSEKEMKKFVVGESNNLAEVVLAMQKADVALRFTSAVANKAVQAYREIMRMQV